MAETDINFKTHVHTLSDELLQDGGTIADLIWEAKKYGMSCIINGKCYYSPGGSFREQERDWMERHSVMGEYPEQGRPDALDNYFNSRAI